MKKLLVTAMFCVLTSGSVAAETQWWEKVSWNVFVEYCETYDTLLLQQVQQVRDSINDSRQLAVGADPELPADTISTGFGHNCVPYKTIDGIDYVAGEARFHGDLQDLRDIGAIVSTLEDTPHVYLFFKLADVPQLASHIDIDTLKAFCLKLKFNLNVSTPRIRSDVVNDQLGFQGRGGHPVLHQVNLNALWGKDEETISYSDFLCADIRLSCSRDTMVGKV